MLKIQPKSYCRRLVKLFIFWVWAIGKIILWKRYLVLCLENFLCYIVEEVSRNVLPAVGLPLYKFNLRIQPVKDLDICSAYFFCETSYELHMLRSSTAWIHRLNLLSENLSQTWKSALFFLLFRISSSPPVILLKVMFQLFRSIWSSSAACTQMRITEPL